MALKPCKECKKEVAANAPTCPHCGEKKPGLTTKETFLGLLGICVIAGITFVACSDSDEEKKEAAAKRVETDFACMNDLQCLGDKGMVAAAIKCPQHIEKLAKGAVKWTGGTLEPNFSRFRWTDEKNGIITQIGDKAQFQNGSGAYVNVIYTCDLDMKNGQTEVLNVTANEGRL